MPTFEKLPSSQARNTLIRYEIFSEMDHDSMHHSRIAYRKNPEELPKHSDSQKTPPKEIPSVPSSAIISILMIFLRSSKHSTKEHMHFLKKFPTLNVSGWDK